MFSGFAGKRCFSCSVDAPDQGSCRLNAGHPMDSKLAPSMVIPPIKTLSGFGVRSTFSTLHRSFRSRSPPLIAANPSCGPFPDRSPPYLLGTAASGALTAAPASRRRRAFLHHISSCAGRRYFPLRTHVPISVSSLILACLAYSADKNRTLKVI